MSLRTLNIAAYFVLFIVTTLLKVNLKVNFYLVLANFFADGGLYSSALMLYKSFELTDHNGNVDMELLEMAFDVQLR